MTIKDLSNEVTFYGAFTLGSIYHFLGEGTLDTIIAVLFFVIAGVMAVNRLF